MNKHWSLTTQDDVAILTLRREDSEMNVFSEDVLREMHSNIEEIVKESQVKGLVFISGKKDHFIVGADIKEIEKLGSETTAREGSEKMQELFSYIENLKIPTVAAIHGGCLGGGLEFSLACTWRVITDHDKTQLSLPEIKLGLIPGAGGTQRLPRLIGLQTALDMILTAKTIRARKALKIGLADAVVPQSQLLNQALIFAKKPKSARAKIKTGVAEQLPKFLLEGNMLGRKIMEKKAREMVDKNTKGFYPAAYKALKAVFEGYDKSLAAGLKLEARLFAELYMTKESQSLIHLFHSMTEGKKHNYKEAGQAVFGEKIVPDALGVIGAGFMGTGIATVCADKGIRVLMSDPNKSSLIKSLKHSYDYFKKKQKKKIIKSFELEQKMVHISSGLTTQGFGQLDLVIEAVFEDINLKQKILADLEKSAGKNWIFATNTSALPVAQIAAKSSHPDRVLGMHFFSPVEKMPLLEIVITDKTADWATARAVAVGQKMGKQIIIVKDSPGFYTTRALSFYIAEAAQMLSEGVAMEKIDRALQEAGFAVGPITLCDEVGIDVGAHVLDTMIAAFPSRMTKPEGLTKIIASGRQGRKNGKGFYLYQEGKKGDPDEEVYKIVGVTPSSSISTNEIVDRCMLSFVNESVRCLEEGILRHGYDGDIGAVFGLGFPPFWGGPFRYVDHIGAKVIVEQLNGLKDKVGSRFTPCDLLLKHAKENKPFFPDEAR
ncbi:MAG: enoyl-CoA hydratase/isomerase family protein [Oligoflexales bacterium]|nr:enoyl-CoA hydratase/isomerase family protein [Oligoflexales bacterium]